MNEKTRDMSILYVEDDVAIREYMCGYLNNRFERVLVAENGAAGFDSFRKNAPDIVMTDVRMPVMDGLEMIRSITKTNHKAAIIITSAYDESRYLLGAIELGISHYLLKPFDSCKVDASLRHCIESVRKAQSARERENSVDEAFLYTITSLARAAEANDEETGNHIQRVGNYCAAICRQIGYTDEMAEIIAQQSQLHDVGKIHIPPETLKKPGQLTEAEMVLMREHTIFGNHPRLEIARTIAQYHHERWDGSGYPFGICGTAIPMNARIVTIADTYDALRNKRSYKPSLDHDAVCRIIMEGDGRTEPSHFDPDLLQTFKKTNREFDEIYEQFAPRWNQNRNISKARIFRPDFRI